MTETVEQIFKSVVSQLRQKLDPLGFIVGQNGALVTGHATHIAPLAYLCRIRPGLDNDGLKGAAAEANAPLPQQYKEFLALTNGADFFEIGLNGYTGGEVERDPDNPSGQAVSLIYQNRFGKPDYVPKTHFCIGAMNGEFRSQGHLYIAGTGEVEMYNAHHNLIGETWPSFAVFLAAEIPRQISLHDDGGLVIPGAQLLPGDTADWEAMEEPRHQSDQ